MPLNKYILLISLTFLLFANATLGCYAQSDGYHFWHLTPEDGLHAESNLSIAQGRDGYIWLTSGNRLQRYDGLEFTNYSFSPDSLFDQQLKTFQIHLVDRDNHVWVSMDTAFYQFIPETKTWKHYSIGPNIPGKLNLLSTFYSTKMLQDRQGNIWLVSGSYGLLVADEARSCFKPAPAKNSIQTNYCTGLVEDREGFLWFSSKNLLCRYDPYKGIFWYAGYNPENHPAIGLRGQAVFIDSRDQIWLSGWQQTCPQLSRVHRKTGRVKTFPYYGISCFAEDRLGRIWMGRYYDKNLYYFDPETEAIVIYPSLWWKADGLHADEHIAQLMMDAQENLWVLDWYNLNVFRPARQQIFTFSHDPSKTGLRLPYHEVNSFLQASDGTVYVSYWHDKGGVAVFDSNMNLQKVWGWEDTSVIFPRYCWTILEDHLGKIWINQQNNYLTIYDPKTGKSQKLNPPEFQGSSPYCAIRDSKNDFWFGLWSAKGLVQWNSREQKLYHCPVRSDKPWNIIKAILEDRNGRDLWLGTEWGLFLFNKDKKSLTGQYRVFGDQSEKSTFIINGINYLNDSTLVLGTTDGLYTFDVRRKKGKPLLSDQGVKTPPNSTGLCLDAKSNVWFDYRTGVGKFNQKTRQVSLYGSTEWVDFITYNGLQTNKFNDGRFLVAVKNHFAVFHPDSLPDAVPPPAPLITRLLLHNRDLPAINWKAEMELKHDNNFITFHFSSLRFFEQALQFRYRLVGLQETWSDPQSDNTAAYTSLPPGRFTFQVQAVNPEGLESPITELSFRIFPPWYATWWFRTGLILAFIALIYAIFRYRELQRLQQEKLRLSIARDLHDEMGSTLSSISILSEAAMRHLQEDIDRKRFGTIGARARQVMEAMSDIVWSVNPRNDSMANILQRMKEFSVELFESQGITLHFEADETVNALNLPMEQRKDFYLLFKEAANNAAKYSDATEVWVLVQTNNGGLRLEVRDNGHGFDPATVKQGNGLWNMQRRAERMGGKLVVESKVGEGTRVEVIITKAL